MFGQALTGGFLDCGMAADAEKSAIFGYLMEYAAHLWLKALLPDYVSVSWPNRHDADIVLCNQRTGVIVRIEIKAARRGNDGKYRATLVKRGHADVYRHSDIVIFLPIVYGTNIAIPYVFPVAELTQTFICIASNPLKYAGKNRKYRQNYSAIFRALGIEG